MTVARSALWFALVLSGSGLGCGEDRRDVFAKGLAVENEAERGACSVHYEKALGASVINGDIVAECLRMTELALSYFDRAAEMGLQEIDFVEVHERARERKARLEGMLKMVRQMERDQVKDEARLDR
jgi:hypothetical protein